MSRPPPPRPWRTGSMKFNQAYHTATLVTSRERGLPASLSEP